VHAKLGKLLFVYILLVITVKRFKRIDVKEFTQLKFLKQYKGGKPGTYTQYEKALKSLRVF
jgi:hypothetical protein